MSLPPTPPGPVPGLATAAALAIDEGWNTCAVTPDRGVVCWGATIRGAVSIDAEGRGRPGAIDGLVDVASIHPAGTPHACALRADGSVACFGSDDTAKLGYPAGPPWTSTPQPVAGLARTKSLATGFGFACAVADDGTVSCWGRNGSGQLGDGTRETRLSPVRVPGLERVVAVAAGREQACALIDDGTVRCWGDMLATRCPDPTPRPVAVPGLSGVVQLSVGWDHVCATLADGTLRCWGDGEAGQLGDGVLTRRYTPAAVPGIADAAAVEAGDAVACALRRDGGVLCWGKNHCGQADGGASGRTYLPQPTPVPGVSDVVQLAVGGMQTCARRKDGSVLCWGATTPAQFSACLAVW